MTKTKIAIFGGGIGGLTVAHELAERSAEFDITIYEKRDVLGGKAISLYTTEGFPAEHSVRTVHHIYYHLRDTLKRIPYKSGNALENITPTLGGPRKVFMLKDHPPYVLPHYFPWTKKGLNEYKLFLKTIKKLVPEQEEKDFVRKIRGLISSCCDRVQDNLDEISWAEFLEANKKSEAFYNCILRLPEFYVAGRGEARASTMGMLLARAIFFPLIHPFGSQHSAADMFKGPSSDVFINPWVEYLKQRHVKFCLNCEAKEIHLQNGKVVGVSIKDQPEKIKADIYVFAIPVEAMTMLTRNQDLKEAIPSLANLDKLQVEPSSGIQFFNTNDNASIFPKTWTSFLDSPWAIIGLYESALLWPNQKFPAPLKGIFSVTWSNFTKPGILYNKPANKCTAEEIKNEILAQIKMHEGAKKYVEGLNIHSWSIDPHLKFSEKDGVMEKHESPLFIPYPGSRKYQPHAYTEADNMFLAADYVRTSFDITTMEAANEAGRRAVNAIIEKHNYNFKPCYVLDKDKTGIKILQFIDKYIYRLQKKFRKK